MIQKKNKTLKAVDFFCSGGGMTYGLSQAGIEVLGGIDIDSACKETYEKNNPNYRRRSLPGFDADHRNRNARGTGYRPVDPGYNNERSRHHQFIQCRYDCDQNDDDIGSGQLQLHQNDNLCR